MANDGVELKVFVSYSRVDLQFADQLAAALEAFGFIVSIDRKGIDPAEDWRARLGQMIIEADAIVFVLTSASAASNVCRWEVDQALALNKRIVPVVPSDLGDAAPHEALTRLNFIFFHESRAAPGAGFGEGLARLKIALTVDGNWIREHTRLSERVARWEGNNRSVDLFARGEELQRLQTWAATRPSGAPDLTEAQIAFIQACEADEAARENAERKRLVEMRLAQEAREAALKEAEAAAAEREKALARAAEEQRRRARAQRRNLWLTTAAAALALSFLAAAAWQTRKTAEREATMLASLAYAALTDSQPEKAMRIALSGLPKPRDLPFITLEWEHPAIQRLEVLLGAAAHSARLDAVIPVPTDVWINEVAVSPDGAVAVTASDAGVVHVWSSATGSAPIASVEHAGDVLALDLSTDGAVAATGSTDGTIRIWSVETGEIKTEIETQGPVRGVRFFDENRKILANDNDGLQLFNVQTGAPLETPWSLDGAHALLLDRAEKFAVRAATQFVEIIDLTSGEVVARNDQLIADGVYGDAVALSPNGAWLAVGGDPARVVILDRATLSERLSLLGHGSFVDAIEFHPGGEVLASGAQDGEILLWDLETGAVKTRMKGDGGEISSLAFTSDGRRLVSGSTDGEVLVWRTDEIGARRPLGGESGVAGASAVAAHPDGFRVAIGLQDGAVEIWDAAAETRLGRLDDGASAPIVGVAFDASGQTLAAANGDGTVRLWSAETGVELSTVETGVKDAGGLVLAPDGRFFLIGALAPGVWRSDAGGLSFWTVGSAEPDFTIDFDAHGGVSDFDVSADGASIVVAFKDGRVEVRSTETGAVVSERLAGDASNAVLFAPSDTEIALSGDVILADATSFEERTAYSGKLPSQTLAFARDGRLLLGGNGGEVTVWDAVTGMRLAVLSESFAMGGPPGDVRMAPGDARLAGVYLGQAFLWDLGWLAGLRGADLAAAVCAKRLPASAQVFSVADVDDPALAGLGGVDVCERR